MAQRNTKTTKAQATQRETRKALKRAWRASMREEHGADWFTKFSSAERERMRCAATGAPTRKEAKAKGAKAKPAQATQAGGKRAKATKRMTKAELMAEVARLRGNAASHTSAGSGHVDAQYDDAGATHAAVNAVAERAHEAPVLSAEEAQTLLAMKALEGA